jgi:hypothetical protein
MAPRCIHTGRRICRQAYTTHTDNPSTALTHTHRPTSTHAHTSPSIDAYTSTHTCTHTCTDPIYTHAHSLTGLMYGQLVM